MIDGIDHSGVITYPPFALTGSCAEMLRKYHEKRNTILLLNTPTNTRKGRVDAEFRAIPPGEYWTSLRRDACGCASAETGVPRVPLLLSGTDALQIPYRRFPHGAQTGGIYGGGAQDSEDYRELANSTVRTGIYADRDVHAFNMLIHLARVGITPETVSCWSATMTSSRVNIPCRAFRRCTSRRWRRECWR